MYKKITLGLMLAFTAHLLCAVEIDTALLDTARKVRYIEDRSPVPSSQYNTGKQIRDTGRLLGAAVLYQENVQKNPRPFADGAPSHKYAVIRVYSSPNMPGADVLYIANNAGVTTTKALFRIVSGYIERAYGIPMQQADRTAEKVCWWNNNHYEDRGYFSARFNPAVLSAFSDKTTVVGLAASWKHWAGKTRIVIPFVPVQEQAPSADEPAGGKTDTSPREMKQARKTVQEETLSGNAQESMPGTPEQPQTAETPAEKAEMPVNDTILFGLLIAAAALLVILLLKVAVDIHKSRR